MKTTTEYEALAAAEKDLIVRLVTESVENNTDDQWLCALTNAGLIDECPDADTREESIIVACEMIAAKIADGRDSLQAALRTAIQERDAARVTLGELAVDIGDLQEQLGRIYGTT